MEVQSESDRLDFDEIVVNTTPDFVLVDSK